LPFAVSGKAGIISTIAVLFTSDDEFTLIRLSAGRRDGKGMGFAERLDAPSSFYLK
jgi:hypothetical protein